MAPVLAPGHAGANQKTENAQGTRAPGFLPEYIAQSGISAALPSALGQLQFNPAVLRPRCFGFS